jgi:uncharacterized hydrophobic protein (TIGR00341 family)
MALRLLELTIPSADARRVPELLGDAPVIHLWMSEPGTATSDVRMLVDAQHVEGLSDQLVGHFGSQDGFRLIVLPVEATLPSVEPPAESEAAEAGVAEPDKGEPLRISREELYEDLAEASRLTPVYAVMVALSTVVAAVGLQRGNVAIVIGAMVIAPLLGPNVALALACTLGDPGLVKRSLKAIGAGLAIGLALASALGVLLRIDPMAPELASRTQADFGDMVLALAAGAAGSLAFTTGVPAVVVGVMVAVALLPPLVVAGLLAGSGHWAPAMGALMLLATNVTCVNFAAVATFLVQKVRPRTWWEAERARKATRLAVTMWFIILAALLGLMLLSYMGAF